MMFARMMYTASLIFAVLLVNICTAEVQVVVDARLIEPHNQQHVNHDHNDHDANTVYFVQHDGDDDEKYNVQKIQQQQQRNRGLQLDSTPPITTPSVAPNTDPTVSPTTSPTVEESPTVSMSPTISRNSKSQSTC